jgi:hypothetical protein
MTETTSSVITEDQGEFTSKVPIQDLLDRVELITRNDQGVVQLRRIYNDRDLSSLFRFTEHDQDLRRAVMDKNIYSIFRLLANHEPKVGSHEDLRKAIVEQNLHSIFRVLGEFCCDTGSHEDLRKAVMEQNLHSLFRCYRDRDSDLVLLDDLRKAVIDQNLYSIFRLYLDTDDLRKAVMEQNMISLFRLIDQEDLTKFVLQDNRFSMYRLLNRSTSTALIPALKRLEDQDQAFYQDSISRGQLQSKLWLIDQVNKLDLDLGTVFLCAGWYAILALMLFESGTKIDKIRSFDRDLDCESLAELFNRPWVIDQWKFKASTMDVLDINYHGQTYTVRRNDGGSEELYDVPDTIINTSCEHIEEFRFWYEQIPEGKLVILQNNDYKDIPDHVNYCRDLEDFSTQTPMQQCLYQGELALDKYTRFMRIGYK